MKTNNVLNRRFNCSNPHQGDYKKILCVCSAGLLRSPTLAVILSKEPYNFNTRAVGLDCGHALVPIDEVLIEWADDIICMTSEQEERLKIMTDKHIINLKIDDCYGYRDKMLIKVMEEKAHKIYIFKEDNNNAPNDNNSCNRRS